MYAAEWWIGGKALWTSYVRQFPVRVFRSTQYRQSRFRACVRHQAHQQHGRAGYHNINNTNNQMGPVNKSFYRYDGLYRIVRVHPPEHSAAPMLFFLTRLDDRMNSGGIFLYRNKIDTEVLKRRILLQRRRCTDCTSRTHESKASSDPCIQGKIVRNDDVDDDTDVVMKTGRKILQYDAAGSRRYVLRNTSFLFQPYLGLSLRKEWSDQMKTVHDLVLCRTLLDLHEEKTTG